MLISTTFTTKKQLLLVARSDYYMPNNAWHLSGDWRYYDFIERTHGLGSNRANIPSVEMGYDWYRFHQVVSRPLWGGLEVGVGYHFDARRNILARDELQDRGSGVAGINTGSTTSSGVSLNLIYDRRDHPLNPERGVLGRASYSFYRADFGSDSDWDKLQLEGRAYQRLAGFRRQVLSVWGIAWFTRAGQPPYFDLPSVGWDTYSRTARGYRAGRFRGHDWVYAEVEYRSDLMRNGLLGGVAFINTSRLSDPTTDGHQRAAHAAGIGIRLKLDKERRSNLALDVAWGRGGSSGVFLAVNEAF
jgi:outer membrane protein assembly factor BamA